VASAEPTSFASDLAVPPAWQLTDVGTSCLGLHALDVRVGLDRDRRVVIDDVVIDYPPTDWSHSFSEWILASYAGQSSAPLEDLLTQDQLDVLHELLAELEVDYRRYSSSPMLEQLFPGLSPDVQRLLFKLQYYLHLFDVDYLLAVLAAAVAQAREDEDPLWLMLIAVSSGGKTEVLRLLDGVVNERLKDVTLPGLLSLTQGKSPRMTGLLTKLQGENALITITDFSALLGDNKRSGETKGDLFNALRDIYDGEYSRTMNGGVASWSGKLTLIAACTPAIDRFTAHADALGTRWLHFRLADTDMESRRRMSEMAFERTELRAKRADAAEETKALVGRARERVHAVELPHSFQQLILDTSEVVSRGRANVPRDYKGAVSDVVYAEDSPRMVTQLKLLALGLLALEVSEEVAYRVVRRAAVSSMPHGRALVLEALAGATGGPLSTNAVAERTGLHRHVAGRALEDWEQVGFVVRGGGILGKTTESADWRIADDRRSDVANLYPGLGTQQTKQSLEEKY
jgi:hypothetical protein